MGKYLSNELYAKMSRTEQSRRSNEAFFSSKDDNENYFGKVKGEKLRVVGLEHIAANGGIAAFNVIKFNDGHQMSTGRFFSARGLRWPVGGNVGKLNYIASALETGKRIEVTPKEVTSTPMKFRDGTYVGPEKDSDGKNKPVNEAEKALQAITYYFEEQELPNIDLIDWGKEEAE